MLAALLAITALTAPQEPGTDTELPLRMAKGRAVPVIQALINGKGPYLFQIDTQSAITMIDDDLAVELEMAPYGKVPAAAASQSASETSRVVTIPILQIGTKAFASVPAVAIDVDSHRFGEPVAGVVGLDLFQDFRVELDFPGGKFRLTEAGLPNPDADDVLEYYAAPGGLPTVEISLGDKIVRAGIDTDSDGGFTLPAKAVEGARLLDEPVVVGRSRNRSGEFEVSAARLVGTLQVGPHAFVAPELRMGPGFESARIGTLALRNFVVRFDPSNELVQLSRAGDSPLRVDTPKARLGLMGRPGEKGLEVRGTVADSPAEAAGLQEGDLITAVNGRSAAELIRSGELGDYLREAPAIVLTVLRNGKELHVQPNLRPR